MNPRLLTLLFLLAALGCYALGMVLPATALLIAGGILELVFWVRLFRRQGSGAAGNPARKAGNSSGDN